MARGRSTAERPRAATRTTGMSLLARVRRCRFVVLNAARARYLTDETADADIGRIVNG
jgi:hypothetical protein